MTEHLELNLLKCTKQMNSVIKSEQITEAQNSAKSLLNLYLESANVSLELQHGCTVNLLA